MGGACGFLLRPRGQTAIYDEALYETIKDTLLRRFEAAAAYSVDTSACIARAVSMGYADNIKANLWAFAADPAILAQATKCAERAGAVARKLALESQSRSIDADLFEAACRRQERVVARAASMG